MSTYELECYDIEMKALVHYKAQAIALRQKGYTYNEILQQIPVAKSSLSLWLKDLPLTAQEKHYLNSKRVRKMTAGRIRAAAANHQNSIERKAAQIPVIKQKFSRYKNDPCFQLGIGLYWAEGAKSSGGVFFTNSDPAMVDLMLNWFETYFELSRNSFRYRLYIHKPYMHENCEQKWAEILNVPLSQFTPTSIKPTNKGVKKRINYIGCMRVEVPKSTNLLFVIQILTEQLIEEYRKA